MPLNFGFAAEYIVVEWDGVIASIFQAYVLV